MEYTKAQPDDAEEIEKMFSNTFSDFQGSRLNLISRHLFLALSLYIQTIREKASGKK